MRIEIDQSGKIEKTNKITVVAFSNTERRSISITGKDKRLIQTLYRKKGQPKIFRYKLFAVLIFALIKDVIKPSDLIIIDREYLGYEKLIQEFILEIAKKKGVKIYKENVKFHLIGKKSRAHDKAVSSFRSKKADIRFGFSNFREYQ
jgi:hypothetical protein